MFISKIDFIKLMTINSVNWLICLRNTGRKDANHWTAWAHLRQNHTHLAHQNADSASAETVLRDTLTACLKAQ